MPDMFNRDISVEHINAPAILSEHSPEDLVEQPACIFTLETVSDTEMKPPVHQTDYDADLEIDD